MYALILHEVDDDGATGPPVTDKGTAVEVGERLGIGEPSDPAGFAIWYVEAE